MELHFQDSFFYASLKSDSLVNPVYMTITGLKVAAIRCELSHLYLIYAVKHLQSLCGWFKC